MDTWDTVLGEARLVGLPDCQLSNFTFWIFDKTAFEPEAATFGFGVLNEVTIKILVWNRDLVGRRGLALSLINDFLVADHAAVIQEMDKVRYKVNWKIEVCDKLLHIELVTGELI